MSGLNRDFAYVCAKRVVCGAKSYHFLEKMSG